MRFALMIEPQQGLTYAEQLAIVQRAEAVGFESFFRSDHYQSFPGPAGEPTTATWMAAITVGAQHVLWVPEQEHELIRELAEAVESARDDGLRGEVVAVIGGCGGAGASLLAGALARREAPRTHST